MTRLFAPAPCRQPFPGRSLPLVPMLAITALYILLRLPHIGHPLAWDEAWILCAIKSLAEGGDATFQNQLWRHPPIYVGLGLFLAPLKQDFAQRMEMLSLVIGTGAFLVFILLTAKILGRRIAAFTGVAYAMLPGPVFYATWIKRDSLVILFCLLAIWAFFNKKDLLAGIFLGLGFLSKESAVFYVLGMIIMLPVLRPRKSLRRAYLAILAPALVISGWWYLFYGAGTTGHLALFQGASAETPLFARPWWYYFAKLRYDLGIPGLLLFAAGLISLLPGNISVLKNFRLSRCLKKNRLLPLYILFPAYLILSLSHGKPPWITIVLLPFLALVIGLGWQFLLNRAADLYQRISGRRLSLRPILASLLLVSLLSYPIIHFNYMGYLSIISPGTINVIHRSYRMAEAVNQSTGNNDKLLLMPMIIQPGLDTQPDPILFWLLKPGLKIYRVVSPGIDFNEVKETIVAEQINRLLIFPASGSSQEKILHRIIREINPEGLSLPGKILIIEVENYWNRPGAGTIPPANPL